MKNYEKTYEDYFTEERKKQYLKIEEISTDIGLDVDEYSQLLKKEFYKYERQIFDILVKYTWLVKRFHYRGKPRKYDFGNGTSIDTVFGMFLRNYANCNKEVFLSRGFYRIKTYFKSFFPNFEVYSPFKNPEKYKFPYNNIGLSHLLVTYQMDERIELLDYAEKHNMIFTDFVNYVMNYAFSYNEDVGYDKYKIGFSAERMVYLKNGDMKNKRRENLV